MIPPRPTMTAEDVRKLREFFDSPAGAAVFDQINAGHEVHALTERRGENFWRDSAGAPLPLPDDVEAASAIPLDFFRPFPAPSPVARLVSPWPIILVALSSIACATLIGWLVSSAMKGHP